MDWINEEAKQLFKNQLAEWDLARTNYEALTKVVSKEYNIDGFPFQVQFNPARIQSSAAKVDPKTIQERKCFLCPANLPSVQKSIAFSTDYQLLVNPYPIFPIHYTIPTYKHTDQLIAGRYGDMLDLSKALDESVIFYNGPQCGASAPDHVHFQAGNKGFLPIEKNFDKLDKQIVCKQADVDIYTLEGVLTNPLVLVGSNKDAIVKSFNSIYALLTVHEGQKEPMLNIITWYEKDQWYSILFPRKQHRPTCFYKEGDDNLLISPASVDLGGVLITPLEKDFNKITAEDIRIILSEVCISKDDLDKIKAKISIIK